MKSLICLTLACWVAAAQADLIYEDDFSYANGSTTNVSGGLWIAHSGTAGTSLVSDGQLEISGSRTEDINRPLGTTYTNNRPGELFYRLDLQVTSLTTSTGGVYIAHFMQGSTTFRDRLYVLTNGVATAGNFLIGIGNGNTPLVTWGNDLLLNTTYRVVVGTDLNTSITSLWIDPTSFASTSVSYTNNPSMNISNFGFRQAAGGGNVEIDSVAVGTDFTSVTVPEPGVLTLLGLGCGALLLRRKRLASAQH